MKNILVVQGGGRINGNTSQLADSFIQGAKEAGHTEMCIRDRQQGEDLTIRLNHWLHMYIPALFRPRTG